MAQSMIFIAGHHDTGKSTLAKFLVENGFLHVETGDIVRRIYKESGTELPFGEWAKQNGHNFDGYIVQSVNAAKEKARAEGKQDVVVTGNRQMEGILHVCNHVAPLEGRKHIIVYTEAEPEVLFTRHQLRPDRRIPGLTVEVFKKEIMGYDKDMGLERIREKSNLVVCNHCDINTLYRCFTRQFADYGYQLRPPTEGEDHCPQRRK